MGSQQGKGSRLTCDKFKFRRDVGKEHSPIEKYWEKKLPEERDAVIKAYRENGYCAIDGLPLAFSEFALQILYPPNVVQARIVDEFNLPADYKAYKVNMFNDDFEKVGTELRVKY